MASLAAIRTALQSRLQSITGLTVYDVWPDVLNFPCAVIGVGTAQYEQTLGPNPDTDVRLEVQLLVSGAPGLARAQRNLDPYLSTSSTGSVFGAIKADRTLGGVVQSSFVHGWRDYGPQDLDIGQALGVIIDVEVGSS